MTTTAAGNERTDLHMTNLHVEVWGEGTPVVLVHGALATGADEWSEQRPLAEHGLRLIVPDRRGYGQSPVATGEDYLADADDVVALMGAGAHLVAHSYGGLSAMIAAARRPEATLSLTLLETPVRSVAEQDADWRALIEQVTTVWHNQMSDAEWLVAFLGSVGSGDLPPGLLDAALPMVPVVRRGRPFFEADLPLDELAAATFPKLVVSGDHHRGFESMSDALAQRIGASRAVVAGAGHEIQFTGAPINEALLTLWRAAAR